MTLPKQKFREAAFVALFSLDLGTESKEHLVKLLMQELKLSMKNAWDAVRFAEQVLEKIPELDEKIAQASNAYEFERIPNVEKNVHRLALYEMEELPGPVAISEAIRLTRKFATAESGSFVNAILDNLLKHGKDSPI